MLKMLLPLLLLLGTAEAAQPPLLWGPNNTTQTVTAGVNLNGNVSLYSGTQDPSVTATIGVKGDLFVRYGASGGKLFIKQDTGTTTNWTYLFAGTPGTGTGDVLHTGNSFGANVTLGANDNFNTSLVANGVAQLTITPSQVSILQNALVSYGKSLEFQDSGSNVISIKAPATATASFPIILPTSLPSGAAECLLIASTGQVTHSACYSGISSVGSGTSLVSGTFNVKSLIGTNNISIVDNGDGTVSLGETNTHLPGTGTVTSVDFYADDSSTFGVTKQNQTSNAVFHLTPQVQGANTVYAAPNNANGNPIWRKIVAADLSSESQTINKVLETDGAGHFVYATIPGALPHVVTTFNTRDGDVVLLSSDVGAVAAATPIPHQFVTDFTALGKFEFAQPAFSDLSGKMVISQFSSATYAANLVPVTDGAGNVNFGPLPVEAVVSITGNYTPPTSAAIIIANCTANCTISLPDISASDGVVLRIKNVSATTQVTITGYGTQNIDSNISLILNAQYQAIDIVSKAGVWNVY